VINPSLYKAQIRVQLGPIKANFNVEVEIVSEIELEEIRSRTRGEEGRVRATAGATRRRD